MNKDTKFEEEIAKLQNDFYATQNKNTFFKSSQKLDCATKVASGINLDDLMQKTFFIIPNTNKVFMDYPLFKAYGHPEIYIILVKYLIYLFNIVLEKYTTFQVHINIDSFTISACQRHKSGIELFLSQCLNQDTEYSAKCEKLYLYNVSSVFDSIRKLINPLIHPSVKQKIEYYNKEESGAIIQQILNQAI